jgi:hypothetical protein
MASATHPRSGAARDRLDFCRGEAWKALVFIPPAVLSAPPHGGFVAFFTPGGGGEYGAAAGEWHGPAGSVILLQVCSVYLLYWYNSTNTDAGDATLRCVRALMREV